ncbi:glycosyltransferase family 4 protein [Thalassotalea litorea]|uniref:Glycosyltransferase family 4 protein n=1 Tax=Thalassotalea litorea TaxID=2020715 RepID=A0A5R9INZ1_9GAMM|nr:glycosyltransferase family 4 protein [Thalassotalea litorea]TLU65777.1 glycosyltransferase family 4 protein [Thalassotalea litorea]
MNILEIVQSLDKGGRTVRFVDTVLGLRKEGMKVYPYSLKAPERALKIDDICVIPRHQGYNFSLVLQLIDIIRQESIDVVHAHCEYTQFYAGLACKLTRTPIVATMHRSDLKKYRPSLLNFCLRFLVDSFVAVSQDRQNKLIEQLSIPSDKTQVVHGGVEKTQKVGDEQRLLLRKKLKIPADVFVLFSLGHLGEIKGHHHTIDALQYLDNPKVHLYIAGSGEEGEKLALRKRVAKHQLQERVHFIGQTDIADEWMQACDIFVQPSLEEAFGLVFIEAGSFAKPVIATSVGGIKEIILNNQTGLLVKPGQSKEIAAAIEALEGDKSIRQSLGEKGFTRIHQKFLLKHMINRYQLIFDELITSKVSIWSKLWSR